MVFKNIITFLSRQQISNYLLLIFVSFFSIVFSKFGFWFDINSFYSNLLRNYEGQEFLKDYFCHFFPIQFVFLSPFLRFLDLNIFIILFSVILNFLFAFQFTYYSKKIFLEKINFFYLFIIISFFFIPFGIGSAHQNELSIYFCTIGFLIAVNNPKKLNLFALTYLVLGLTIKYSIALPIFAAIFFAFLIALLFDFKKYYFFTFLKYFFFIPAIFFLITFLYNLNSNIGLNDIFRYLFLDTLVITESRLSLKDFIFFNLFYEIFNFLRNINNFNDVPVGSILQLPIILFYLGFIYNVLCTKNLLFKKRLFFYFLVFASIFLWVSLGRDWNHKIIFFIITNYFLLFYFFDIEKKLSNFNIKLILFAGFFFYLIIPINERVPLKNLVKNSNYETKDYFFQFSKNSPFVALKRSKFETNHGIKNLHKQYSEVTNYLSRQKNLSLFFVDDLSTNFATVLSKAPSDTGCFHTWLVTPPLNKGVREKWISVFLENYNNNENSKLVICKTDDGRLCLFSPSASKDGKFRAIEPTKINENDFIKELISNSKISFRTKNFYIYEKK